MTAFFKPHQETAAEYLAAEEALAVELEQYVGQWVAVKDHHVFEHAETLGRLLEMSLVGSEGIFCVPVPGGASFFHLREGDIERINDLAQASAPAPWFHTVNDLIGGSCVATVDKPASEIDPCRPSPDRILVDMVNPPEADLIVALRNAWPTIYALLTDLQKEPKE